MQSIAKRAFREINRDLSSEKKRLFKSKTPEVESKEHIGTEMSCSGNKGEKLYESTKQNV